jgi:hypothetical protein
MVNAGMVTADWADLEGELDAWGGDGRVATLWWRDDDAVRMTPALGRLLGVAAATPVALAVIPGRMAESDAAALGERLTRTPGTRVLQHGWMHINHAAPPAKKAELGSNRPAALILAELASGRRRIAGLLGPLALPVLTPPWNRIATTLPPLLSGIGLRGLSAAGPRRRAEAAADLVQVNIHADLVAWPTRTFVGTATALGRIVAHLRARRQRTVDSDEPTGILTHHLVQDHATDAFLGRLLEVTNGHTAARWVGAAEAFAA